MIDALDLDPNGQMQHAVNPSQLRVSASILLLPANRGNSDDGTAQRAS